MARKELSALNVNDPATPPATSEAMADRGLRVRNVAKSFGARQVGWPSNPNCMGT